MGLLALKPNIRQVVVENLSVLSIFLIDFIHLVKISSFFTVGGYATSLIAHGDMDIPEYREALWEFGRGAVHVAGILFSLWTCGAKEAPAPG